MPSVCWPLRSSALGPFKLPLRATAILPICCTSHPAVELARAHSQSRESRVIGVQSTPNAHEVINTLRGSFCRIFHSLFRLQHQVVLSRRAHHG